MGDAAHTIHPLAGQGVNLGYRDVDALIDVLVNARSRGEAWASYPILKRYQMRRMADNFIMQSGMAVSYTHLDVYKRQESHPAGQSPP